jgi:hypothetical protein
VLSFEKLQILIIQAQTFKYSSLCIIYGKKADDEKLFFFNYLLTTKINEMIMKAQFTIYFTINWL